MWTENPRRSRGRSAARVGLSTHTSAQNSTTSPSTMPTRAPAGRRLDAGRRPRPRASARRRARVRRGSAERACATPAASARSKSKRADARSRAKLRRVVLASCTRWATTSWTSHPGQSDGVAHCASLRGHGSSTSTRRSPRTTAQTSAGTIGVGRGRALLRRAVDRACQVTHVAVSSRSSPPAHERWSRDRSRPGRRRARALLPHGPEGASGSTSRRATERSAWVPEHRRARDPRPRHSASSRSYHRAHPRVLLM